jgi:hypothetical protein
VRFMFRPSTTSGRPPKPSIFASRLLRILMTTTLLAQPSSARKQTFCVANQRLGETLDHFKQQFPQVACGSLTDGAAGPWTISRHNLTDPNGSAIIYCCLDLISRVSLLSPGRSYQLERSAPCPGYAIFQWEKLFCLGFMIEGVSLEDLLPEFEHEYGPVDWHDKCTPQEAMWERTWNPTGMPWDCLKLTGPVKKVDRSTRPMSVVMIRYDWYVPKKVDPDRIPAESPR